jgi:hypothetical protein
MALSPDSPETDSYVIAGLDPAIQQTASGDPALDGRIKSGHDELDN